MRAVDVGHDGRLRELEADEAWLDAALLEHGGEVVGELEVEEVDRAQVDRQRQGLAAIAPLAELGDCKLEHVYVRCLITPMRSATGMNAPAKEPTDRVPGTWCLEPGDDVPGESILGW